ncbi:MAG: hypothetical protein AAF496_17260, partial [Pseudomonadota bacterium]
GLRPYAPVHLAVAASATGDAISWVRRTRTGGDDWAALDVPLGEESESYLVRIRAQGALLRETLVHAPNWFYANAMKAADGLSGPFEVQVAQVSASFGPGAFARIEVS